MFLYSLLTGREQAKTDLAAFPNRNPGLFTVVGFPWQPAVSVRIA